MAHQAVDFRASIRSAMREQHVTQAELAARSGVPQPNISRYLSGASDINGDTLQRLCAALGLVVRDA